MARKMAPKMVPEEGEFCESHSRQSTWQTYAYDGHTVRRTGGRKQRRGWLESWGNVAKVKKNSYFETPYRTDSNYAYAGEACFRGAP